MAETYLEQAKARLQTARRAYRKGNYAFTVRQSQECVELSLKGALRLYGIEYPREHDVGKILPLLKNRFPPRFVADLDELAKISSELAKFRGPSMYGDEEKGIPPSELFKKSDAAKAKKNAGFVYKRCGQLYKGFLKKLVRRSHISLSPKMPDRTPLK